MAAESDFDAPDREFGWLFGALMFGVIGSLAVFAFHRPIPMPAPNTLAGCYVSDEAPPLKLAGDTLSVGQPGFTPVKFYLAWTKEVPIVIESDPNVQVIRGDDQKLRFVKNPRYFSNLYPAHMVDGKVWGVLKPGDRQFIAAKEGNVVQIFKPAPPSACAGI